MRRNLETFSNRAGKVREAGFIGEARYRNNFEAPVFLEAMWLARMLLEAVV